jgi:FixJ family two-component response regulator
MNNAGWETGGIATRRVPASTTAAWHQIAVSGPVCVVDDDDWVCDSLKALLETYGYDVWSYASGGHFLQAAERDRAKCLVIDQHMPELDGLDVVAALRRQGISCPTILITGRLDAKITERANGLGVLAILEKPFATTRLIELVQTALAIPD